MTAITMATYQQVVAALLKGTEVIIQAKYKWNGFVPDVKYQLSILAGRPSAVDQHGLTSVIDYNDASEHFSLVTELALEEVAPATPFHIRLTTLCSGLTEDERDFKVGDLVVWKDGLSNRNQPQYFEPVVVTKVFGTTIRSDQTSSTPYFNEPLSLMVGQISEYNGEEKFFELAVDGRRFRLYDPAVDGEYSPEKDDEPSGFFAQALGRSFRNQAKVS